MKICFGSVPVSSIKEGAQLFDNETGKNVEVTFAYRETPDPADHSGLFGMYVGLNGSKPSWVDITAGEVVHRFNQVG